MGRPRLFYRDGREYTGCSAGCPDAKGVAYVRGTEGQRHVWVKLYTAERLAQLGHRTASQKAVSAEKKLAREFRRSQEHLIEDIQNHAHMHEGLQDLLDRLNQGFALVAEEVKRARKLLDTVKQ